MQRLAGRRSRLPQLDLGELRQEWRALYKAEASPHLSRELLIRAVAYRMQEVALGGLGPERQRQLRQIAQQFKQTGEATIRARPELKPGTRLVREWQGRTYEVLVLDGGFSWLDTHHRSLSALARKITGTAWSGPLFFGLKPTRPANRCSSPPAYPTADAVESSNAAGVTPAASVARSTPANPPRKGSSRNSIRSRRSAKPARPSSAASATRAGYWSKPATTMAVSPVAIWSDPPCNT